MKKLWLFKPRYLVFIPVLVLLVIALACGDDATPTPTATTQPTATPPPAVPTATTAAAPAPTATTAGAPPTVVPTPTPAPALVVPDWVKQGKYGTTINFSWSRDPGFLDVHYGGSESTTLTPSGPRFNQLIEFNPVKTDEVIGDLAETWDLSSDGKVYTFHIADAKWSDGKPVTTKDVVFSLDRIVEPDAVRGRSASLRRFYEHGTAKIIDERTVEVPIKFVAATFFINLALDYMKMYPEHIVKGQSQEDLNCCFENLIGSGPWVWKEWVKEVSYAYEKNANYFKEGRPFFDGFKVFIIRDIARQLAALKIGQVVGTYGPYHGPYLPKDMATLEKETGGQMRAMNLKDSHIKGFIYHINKPPFDDPRVRRALYLAVDREEVTYTVHGEDFSSIGTWFAPGTVEDLDEVRQQPGYRMINGKKDPQDIAEAKRLLTEAGYPDGKGLEITFNLPGSKTTIAGAEVWAEQLRNVLGAKVDLKTHDTATYYVHLRDATYNISSVGGGRSIPDPSDTLNTLFQKGALRNPHDWSDPVFDKLVVDQEKELDPVKRKAVFKKMVDFLRSGESHLIILGWYDVSGALDYRFQNYVPAQTSQTVHKWEHAWWDPDAPKP